MGAARRRTARSAQLVDAARHGQSRAPRRGGRDEAQRLKLCGHQAMDRGMIADAAELQLTAERKLGEMLVEGQGRWAARSAERRMDRR
jgi:hypothetical protein